MLKSIIYIISIVILFATFLLINKSNKKQNLLFWIFISIMILFCYNAIIVYILSFLHIHSTLISLSIVNLLISILLYMLLIRHKQVQKYYIKKLDILAIAIVTILIIIIGFLRYGFPFKIVYETVDPGIHFWTSMDFFRESILLNKADTAIDFSARVFGSYVNTGILFKISYPFVGYINLYAIYIFLDLFMLFMSGIMFYFFVSYRYKKNNFFINIISSILYFLGYPLNSMIFGFFYSGHVVTLFIILILLFSFLDNKEIKEKHLLSLITLLNVGICFTYYLYTPIVIVSELLYFYLKYRKELNIKQLIKKYSLVILIPLFLTILYFFIPYIGTNQHSVFYQLTLDGYFYNSWYSNFIIFIPLIIFYIINKLKKKEINFEIWLFFLVVSFILLIILLSFFNIAVHYYASKIFYLLWLLCFILTFNLFDLENINKQLKIIYMCTYLFIFISIAFKIEENLYDMNELWGNRLESTNLLNIYSYNIDKIDYPNIQFTLEEIDMLRNLYELNANNVINKFLQAFNHQRLWINAFFWEEKLDYPENELYDNIIKNSVFFDPLEEKGYWNINNYKYHYYIVFYRNYDTKKYMNYEAVIPFEVQRRWDTNFRKDYVINDKALYDNIDRSSCLNCQFIDFDAGMIIIKPKMENE